MGGFRLTALGCFAGLAMIFGVCATAARLHGQAAAATTPGSTAAPDEKAIEAASEKDHQRMMDLLGIKTLRPGEQEDANWDLSKANPYPNLPDPLIEKSGKRVTTAAEWWKVRRGGDCGGL